MGKKKDEKSTTAVASTRGKWDMKRDVFLTYLSDNREAGHYKSHISTSRNEPRIRETGCCQISGPKMCVYRQGFLEIMAALLWKPRQAAVITGWTLLFTFSENRLKILERWSSDVKPQSSVIPECWFVQKSNQLEQGFLGYKAGVR